MRESVKGLEGEDTGWVKGRMGRREIIQSHIN